MYGYGAMLLTYMVLLSLTFVDVTALMDLQILYSS